MPEWLTKLKLRWYAWRLEKAGINGKLHALDQLGKLGELEAIDPILAALKNASPNDFSDHRDYDLFCKRACEAWLNIYSSDTKDHMRNPTIFSSLLTMLDGPSEAWSLKYTVLSTLMPEITLSLTRFRIETDLGGHPKEDPRIPFLKSRLPSLLLDDSELVAERAGNLLASIIGSTEFTILIHDKVRLGELDTDRASNLLSYSRPKLSLESGSVSAASKPQDLESVIRSPPVSPRMYRASHLSHA